MPKVGVGIACTIIVRVLICEVSIHLCPKWALEFQILRWYFHPIRCFNPSMPKVGVGIIITNFRHVLIFFCFNPSMPKVGVGINSLKIAESSKLPFQSIYAQSGRWNSI